MQGYTFLTPSNGFSPILTVPPSSPGPPPAGPAVACRRSTSARQEHGTSRYVERALHMKWLQQGDYAGFRVPETSGAWFEKNGAVVIAVVQYALSHFF